MASESSTERGRPWARVRGWLARGWEWLDRAYRSSGQERNTVLLILKSTLAATIAWAVSDYALNSVSPAFAPFSAVLLVHVTVYQSIVQSLRYVGAVIGGVALQGALGFALGPSILVFALMVLVALIISRWRALGSQGNQVVTAACFAFAVFSATTAAIDGLTQLGDIMFTVLIGCSAGVIVNITVFPPLRYRTAESGVHMLSGSIGRVLSDMAPVLREQGSDDWPVDQWWQRALELRSISDQARQSIAFAHESTYYNPRQWWQRKSSPQFRDYEETVESLDRAVHQLISISRALQYQHWIGSPDAETSGFYDTYGAFCQSLSEYMTTLEALKEGDSAEQLDDLDRAAEDVRQHYRDMCESTSIDTSPRSGDSRTLGVLLIEAQRLADEVRYCTDNLRGEDSATS